MTHIVHPQNHFHSNGPPESDFQRRMNALPHGEAMQAGPGEHEIDFGAVVSKEDKKRHDEVKKALITHFSVALQKGEVVWPRRIGNVYLYNPSR